MGKNEVLTGEVETNEIVTINKTEFNKFKTAYNSAGKAMYKVCVMAYDLCEKDEKGFKKMCADEMNLPAHTITKLKVAGEIAHNAKFALPESYSNIYELSPVREQLDEFGEYIEENEIDLSKEGQTNTRKIVKDYLTEGEEETEETEETEEPEEAEETEETEEAEETEETEETEEPEEAEETEETEAAEETEETEEAEETEETEETEEAETAEKNEDDEE